jgi:hypothetical protein
MRDRLLTIGIAWLVRFFLCVGIGLVIATACWGVWLIRSGHTIAQGIAGGVEDGIGTLHGLWAVGGLVGHIVGAAYATASLLSQIRRDPIMEHSERPRRAEQPHPGSREAIRRILYSDYYPSLRPLLPAVKEKVVADSLAGTSGFVLCFKDGSWVASYLAGETLSYELGEGTPPEATLARLNNPAFGDASRPLTVDLPYANESCDIAAEVKKVHGRVIKGLTFGERTFNFRFPDGLELDTSIVPDPSGKIALRVFFEQW